MIAGVVLGRPSPGTIDRLLARAVAADRVTYPHVGSTGDGWTGDRSHRYSEHRDVGRGPDVFARVAAGVRSWAAQRHIGATVHPVDAPVALGQTVLVALPRGPVTMVAPCRIVSVTDQVDEVGFAYGTLAGHPERGEERFTVQLRADGTVRATVTVDTRHGHPLVRMVGPIATWTQRRALRGYLDGLEELA